MAYRLEDNPAGSFLTRRGGRLRAVGVQVVCTPALRRLNQTSVSGSGYEFISLRRGDKSTFVRETGPRTCALDGCGKTFVPRRRRPGSGSAQSGISASLRSAVTAPITSRRPAARAAVRNSFARRRLDTSRVDCSVRCQSQTRSREYRSRGIAPPVAQRTAGWTPRIMYALRIAPRERLEHGSKTSERRARHYGQPD